MFGLMTKREHEDLMLSMESEQVYLKQKVETLCERIQLGEEYRARLEMEIASLKGKNRELVHQLEGAQIEIDEKLSRIERLNMKIRELELMLGSFEAQWSRRNDSLFENRKAREDSREPKAPRLPPLARDDRRREVCA